MGSFIETIQKRKFIPTMPYKDDLPISRSNPGPNPSIRKRISSFSVRIQPLSTASTAWAFRKSKSMPSLGDFAGGPLKRWWASSWAWILSRKPTFAKDLEMNEEEVSMLGCHSRGSLKHLFYKVRSEIRKLVRSQQNLKTMVDVIETSVVVPSKETPRGAVWLSNLDLLVARSHTPTVYFYRPGGGPGFFSAEPLKEALGEALVHFYPLAGRLGLDPAGRVQIECTGEGVLFVVARSELSVDGFGDFSPSDEMRRMLVPAAGSPDSPCMLVMFQVTFFKCGGVCLGAAVHHTAADGLGALHFVNAWSDLARNPASPVAVPPFLDRTLLRSRSPPSVLFDHPEYSPKPPSTDAKSSFVSANLYLSKNQIKLLKANKTASTFKAVVAHVWRSACKARSLEPHEPTRLLMTADARARMHPPLPAGYLGNAIFRSSAVATAGDISSNTIEFGAEKIGEATKKLNDEYVRSLIDYLDAVEDVKGLQKGKWAMPRSDLWVISWQGLPIYEADFGWGRPVFMGRACLQFAGLVYVMQEPGEGGGITLAVALEPESMERFKEVIYEDLEV